MKVLCVNNEKITLEVTAGYPTKMPENGNLSLMFLKEVTYYGALKMKVGQVYEVSKEKINYYGHLMYWFDEFPDHWRPAAAFIDWNPEELVDEKEEAEANEFYLELGNFLKNGN